MPHGSCERALPQFNSASTEPVDGRTRHPCSAMVLAGGREGSDTTCIPRQELTGGGGGVPGVPTACAFCLPTHAVTGPWAGSGWPARRPCEGAPRAPDERCAAADEAMRPGYGRLRAGRGRSLAGSGWLGAGFEYRSGADVPAGSVSERRRALPRPTGGGLRAGFGPASRR